MQRKRRSGRIAKELQIVLLGTDTTGKVFSEPTKTVVLSRHGAGVVSRYRFTPDEVLTLRLPDSTKEAEVRLVGQIGGEPGRYVYGVAFVDPDPHFWPMEFPPPEEFEAARPAIVLECIRCQAHQNVEQSEIEEDVYSVNGFILRFCADCGISTQWKKANGAALPASAEAAQAPSPSSRESKLITMPAPNSAAAKTNFTPALSGTFRPDLDLFASSLVASLGPPAEPRAVALADAAPSYSGASAVAEFASFAEIQASPTVAAVATAVPSPEFVPAPSSSTAAHSGMKPQFVPPREVDTHGRPKNRRRHIRIRVNFSACVRHPAHTDEVVECENVSKGGVCFHSIQQYAFGTTIEIAAPYSPGETALFVPAQIKRIEPLSAEVFRYGVEYLNSPSSSFPSKSH